MAIGILIVDDSEVIRFLLKKSLERDPQLRVIATAGNGIEGIAMAKKHTPCIILLDVEMPVMDGLTALPNILAVSPQSKIIVITGNAHDHAKPAIDSLSLGASEFILKPGANGSTSTSNFYEDLRIKISALAANKNSAKSNAAIGEPPAVSKQAAPEGVHGKFGLVVPPITQTSNKKIMPITALRKPISFTAIESPAASAYSLVAPTTTSIHAVAFASSTGGPETLAQILVGLKEPLKHLPLFITQHMPAVFTAQLADQLSHQTKMTCCEAQDGQMVKPGVVYIAPGGYHMIIRNLDNKPTILITNDPPVNSCRPSADPMLASLSAVYGSHLLAVVLTGIGSDGLAGATQVRSNGGTVIAQDKATSVIYGMPKAVAEANLCEAVLAIEQIPDYLTRRCRA